MTTEAMTISNQKKHLIVIVGPTAIGKTAFSIQLAQLFNTEIISADSRQFFKEMSIGTAKPSAEELSQAPHHFIGNISIYDVYSAGKFEQDALAIIEEKFNIHNVLIMVGGSGLYINAVCNGIDDIPLVVQTKAFDSNNQLLIESALDTSLMVNGTIRPYWDAPAQVIRLRLLNGSSERYFNFGFSANKKFYQIASDASLLNVPVELTRLMIAPGERAEILVDLSVHLGQSIDLMNFGQELPNGIYGASQPGMGMGQQIPGYNLNPLNGTNFSVLKINVGEQIATPILTIPSSLITLNPYLESTSMITRSFVFTSTVTGQGAIQGPFLINGQSFNMSTINFETFKDNIEIWELRNQSPIGHPFHLHAFPFYILSINGNPPPPNLRGKKDVVHVPAGNGVVRFITVFDDFSNDSIPYMYHCHMLTHEDDGMMGQFLVKDVCGLEIINQPENVNATEGGNVAFSVQTNNVEASFQWQSDIGFGFQNLSNAGQYSGVNTPELKINNISFNNNNQMFRCIISETTSCTFTTENVSLTVLPNLLKAPYSSLLKLFPNPTSNILHVIRNTNEIESFVLTDVTGRIVLTGLLTTAQFSINTTELNKGVYLFHIHGSEISQKFVKK
jgi:FtsP/CotA-like multicopper oxidase with cupredoxin domain